MSTNEELRQQMWELAYGLLTPEETASLHARIKSDPVAARLYAEVRLQADLVADAAKVHDPSFSVSAQGEPARPMPARHSPFSGSVHGKTPSRGMNWLAGAAGAALAALLCVVLFRPIGSSDPAANQFVATAIEAPARLQAGITQQVSVFTCAPDETGTPADVEVRLVDAAGKERLRQTVRTDDNGHAKVELPGSAIEPGVRLEAAAKKETPTVAAAELAVVDQPVSLAVEVIPEPIERHLLLDKPAYERGDTVRYAVREVKRFSKEPVVEAGPSLELRKGLAPDGREDASPQLAEQRHDVVTGAVPLDSLALDEAEQDSSADEPKKQDAPGRQRFYFDQISGQLPLLAGMPAQAEAFAAKAAPADAPPAEAGIAGGFGAQQATDFGRSRLMATASPHEEPIFATVVAGAPLEVPLPAGHAADLLVTAKCGDRIVAKEVVTRAQLELAGSKLSKTADSDAAAPSEPATLKLTPVPEADGVIQVSVFDRSQQPPQLLASYRYYREPQQRLQIELKNLRERYEPGQPVELQVQVLDEQMQPVDATLAVRVWNEQLVQAAGARVSDLAGTVLTSPPASLPALSALAIQKFQFGGLGGGGPAVAGDVAADSLAMDAPAAGSGLADASMPALELNSLAQNELLEVTLDDVEAPRLEASNLAAVRSAYEAAVVEARQAAAQRKATIARLLMIGGLAVLGLLAMQALLRMSPKASVWLPAVSIAAASLLIGLVWWSPSFERGEAVQMAAVPAAKHEAESSPSSAKGDAMMRTFSQTDSTEGDLDNASPPATMEAPPPLASRTPGAAALKQEGIAAMEAAADKAVEVAPPLAAKEVEGQPRPPGEVAESLRAEASVQADAGARSKSPASAMDAAPAAPSARAFAARGDLRAAGAPPAAAAMSLPQTPEPPTSDNLRAEQARSAKGVPDDVNANAAADRQLARRAKSAMQLRQSDRPQATPEEKFQANVVAPPALLFEPVLATDSQGQATVTFTLPDVDCEYRVLIDAIGHGRVGSLQKVIVGRSEGGEMPEDDAR